MLESCWIHPKLGCLLDLKSIEIPRQMVYLNQSLEATVVPQESMNLPIGKYSKAFINRDTYLLTIGHQKCASILNKVICSWIDVA